MPVAKDSQRMTVGGFDVEWLHGGSGKPVLLLHAFHTLRPKAPFLSQLAKHCSYLAPSLPGFGASTRPKDFDTIYALVRHTLDLIDATAGEKITLIGFSFGGWLAAEAAVVRPAKLDRLILVDPVGIRISDRETRDILDIFNVHPELVRDKTFHDPKCFAPDF